MKWTMMIAALLLSACNSGDADALSAEKQYQIVAERGVTDEKCAAARRAAEAWLKRENQEKYTQWSSTRDADCGAADLQRMH